MNIDPRPAAARRKPEGPRRLRHGLKLRRKTDEPLPWPAAPWKAALEATIPPTARIEGLEYARVGQIVTLLVLPPANMSGGGGGGATSGLESPSELPRARVEAVVQGRSARPYSTIIEIVAWQRSRWDLAIDAMAREAIYAAKILSGELPTAVDELCRALGASLLPAVDETFEYSCTCGESVPCKHHAAAILILAERLAEQPLLAFNLRGMPHEIATARLQEARTLHTHGSSTAHAGGQTKSAARPFEACLADFWRPGPQLLEFERLGAGEHVPHAILRRLGPSPLQGRFPLVGLLASIYDSVRIGAQQLRSRAESSTANTPPASDPAEDTAPGASSSRSSEDV